MGRTRAATVQDPLPVQDPTPVDEPATVQESLPVQDPAPVQVSTLVESLPGKAEAIERVKISTGQGSSPVQGIEPVTWKKGRSQFANSILDNLLPQLPPGEAILYVRLYRLTL